MINRIIFILLATILTFPAAARCIETREIETNTILARYGVSMDNPSSLNAIRENNLTPLAEAALENDRKAVELLLEKGAKLGLDSYNIKRLMPKSEPEIFHELAKKFSISLNGSAWEPFWFHCNLKTIKYLFDNRICGFENLDTESVGLWFERADSSPRGFYLARRMNYSPEETLKIFEKYNMDSLYKIDIIDLALKGDNPAFAKYLINRTPRLNFTSLTSFVMQGYRYDDMDEIYEAALEHYNYEDAVNLGALSFILNELMARGKIQVIAALLKKDIRIGRRSLNSELLYMINDRTKASTLALFIDNISDTKEIFERLRSFTQIDEILKPETIDALKRKGISTDGDFGSWVIYQLARKEKLDLFIEKLNAGFGLKARDPNFDLKGKYGAQILEILTRKNNMKALNAASEKGLGSKYKVESLSNTVNDFFENENYAPGPELDTEEMLLWQLSPSQKLDKLLKNPSFELTSPTGLGLLNQTNDFELIKNIVDKNVSRLGQIDEKTCQELHLYENWNYDKRLAKTILYICRKKDIAPDCVIKIFLCTAIRHAAELIEIGGEKLLKKAWDSGVHLDRVNSPYNYTYVIPCPASFAAAAGNMEALKFLVENGISADTESLLFALQAAVKNPKDDISKYLADILEPRNVNIRLIRRFEDYFIQKGHSKWIQRLIAGTETPILRECLWRKYITKAVEINQFGLMKDLIKNNPEMNVKFRKTKGDWSFFQHVIMSGNPEAFDLMIEKGALDPHNDYDIVIAARDGRTEFVKKLLEKGYSANARASGWTPLLLAAGRNDTVLAMLLVEHGADVGAICFEDNYIGETPLSLAKKNRNKKLVDLFRLHGASDDTRLKSMKARCKKYDHRYTKGWTPLLMAARNNDTAMVEYFIFCGFAVHDVCYDESFAGMTPLAFAIANENKTLETMLVNGGALKAVNDNLLSARLIVSAMAGNVETLKKNLADGADINARDRRGASAVSLALHYGHIAAARYLIERGAEVGSHDVEGRTALHHAIGKADLKTIKMIISRGADIKALDKNGNSIVSFAVSFGRKDLVEYFHSIGVGIDDANYSGWKPLHVAVLRRNKAIIEYLVKNGANVNAMCGEREFAGFTPLMLQEIYGKSKIIRDFLIAAGARRNPVFYGEKNVALMKAVKNGTLDEVKKLVNRGADVDSFDTKWNTPIFEAVRLERNDIVEFLANNSKKIDNMTYEGKTALELAARKRNAEAVKILIKHGAMFYDRNRPGGLVALHAMHSEKFEFADFLLNAGAPANKIYRIKNLRGMINFILGFDYNAKTYFPHFLLAGPGTDNNAYIDECDSEFYLHYALKYCHRDTERAVGLLIDHGADLNERGVNEATPLMRAAQNNYNEIAKMFIRSGARTDLRDDFGKTALDYALENANEDIIRAIENKH